MSYLFINYHIWIYWKILDQWIAIAMQFDNFPNVKHEPSRGLHYEHAPQKIL